MCSCQEPALPADQRLTNAIQLFNQHDWYAAHDAFEELWHESFGEIRALLHGLIQISVAEFHCENGNYNGSTLLMAEGLNHLSAVDSVDLGLDLPRLKSVVGQRLLTLQEGSLPSHLPLPVLEQASAHD